MKKFKQFNLKNTIGKFARSIPQETSFLLPPAIQIRHKTPPIPPLVKGAGYPSGAWVGDLLFSHAFFWVNLFLRMKYVER